MRDPSNITKHSGLQFSIVVLSLLGCVIAASSVVVGCQRNNGPPTAEESEYSKWFEGMLEKAYALQKSVDAALEKVREQPEDKYNVVVLGRELIRFDIYYEEAERRGAPESLKSVHETLLTGLREYKLAAEDVEHFADHIVEGEESLFASAELYEKWRERHR